MKIVKMQGGLGNQLFCVAFARSIALIGGAPAGLDLSPFGGDLYGRAWALGDLAARLGLLEVRRPLKGSRIAGRLARALQLPGRVVEPQKAPADRSHLERLIARGDYFDGYWQAEAYMADAEDFRRDVRRLIAERAGTVPRAEVVIHYRTYKEERRPAARKVPPAGYFRAAITAIEAAAGRPREIALVSDDPDLALARLGDLEISVRPVRSASPWSDLALMAGAEALILTNSSFSWWGGYAADAPRIFYPRPDDYVHYPAPARKFTLL